MSHPRDEELRRILLYAKGLGIKIRIANYAWDDSGEFAHEPVSEININKRVHTSKTELILTILHELGHHLYFVYTKKEIPEAAYVKKASKRERKKLYEYEAAGIAYMLIIWTELNLKIPRWKVEKSMEQDTWVYEFYYLNNRYPNKKEKQNKNIELNLKYKGKA